MLKKLKVLDLIKLMKYMKPRAVAYFAGLFGYSLAEASIVILIPITIKYMVDAAIKGEMALLHKGLILAVSESVAVCVLFIIFVYLYLSTVNKTVTDIKIRMFRHVVRLPITYFEKNHSGDLISRLSNDVNVLNGAYGWILQQILFISFSGIGSLVLMIVLEWRFSIILLLVAALSAIINSKFSVKIRDTSNVLQKVLAELTERISDMLSGFTVMKMFHIEEVLKDKFSQKKRRGTSSYLFKIKNGSSSGYLQLCCKLGKLRRNYYNRSIIGGSRKN
ncbi:MAG TPA: ABC transporter ATP-binding protein [Clostridia bacterium]|nr:ABC transporter ATP-binding protein [Clostridia bacterium]